MTMTSRNPLRGPAGRLARAAAAALAAATLVVACTGSGGDDTPRQGGGRAAGGGPAQSPPASVRGDLSGLVLGDASLRREGGGVTLRATVTNQGEDSVTIGDLLGPGGLTRPPIYDSSGVYLYDGNARKRYQVLRDADACRCSKVPLAIEPGQKLELFATFPDLPGPRGELSAVVPHFPPLDGLRIQG
jgi:hypothetical protein